MGNLLNGASYKEPSTVEECDSTWETDSGGEEEDDDEDGLQAGAEESEGEEQRSEGSQNDSSTSDQNFKPKRSFYAARDLYKYRHQYPNFKDLRCQNDLCNLRFYMNKIPFKPDGVYIEDILNKWKYDYDKLEHNHTYIQWLFPLREQGLNFYAKELTSYEIEEFKKTKEATKRFVMAYKMMLDFLGLKLVDKNGNVSRSANWQERFQHLNESQHNYLRITRILKSLGELGYEHFKAPLVKIFLQESIVENTIPNMKQSALEYFVYTIKERRERRRLLRYAYHYYQPPDHFIWGPPTKQKAQRSKSVKKTIASNRSLKKHVQKSQDAKIEQEQVKARIGSFEEKLTDHTEVETNPETAGSIELVENCKHEMATVTDDDKMVNTELKFLSTHRNDTTNISLYGNKLMEKNTEHLGDENNTNRILVVDAIDEDGKDCLCSLSPGTTAESNTTEENLII
ncbi:opioid growth factor receptor-like protein 1 isoform X2 [Pyxicephalus adspersus]|uniref:Opioid growth factor receptor (OGFr) conserved domain-containing protein n=1 Tax=Pyxicephalus adspersus TaxID=30357 RepID=A0AAV3AHE2_PYXAD|nr:TPA: hypothetical protein GDO54_010679 [Pyxicephalus adspersus]